MGSALTDEDAAIGTSNPTGGSHLSPPPAQRSVPPHATVVRLTGGDALRESRRVPQRRPRPGRSPSAPLTVLTNDSGLEDLILAAVPPEYRVFIATTLEEVEEYAATDRCAIFLTDQTVARGELDRITAILRAHEPGLVTIAIGDREQDEALVDLLAEGVIDRFIVRPLKPEPTRLVIESAAREHHSLKARSRAAAADSSRAQAGGAHEAAGSNVTASFRLPTQNPTDARSAPESRVRPATTSSSVAADRTPAPASIPVPERPDASTGTQPPRVHGEDAVASRALVAVDELTRVDWRTNETIVRMETPASHVPLAADAEPAARTARFVRSPWFGAALGIIVTAAIAAFVVFRQSPGSDLQQVIARNLVAAQTAFEQGSLVDPPEASALQLYRTVLALDPDNIAARNGLERIASRLIEDTRVLIREQRLTQAVESLQRVRRVQPDHPELAALNTQLRLALQARLLEQARAAASTGTTPEQATANERRTSQGRSTVKDATRAQAPRADKQGTPTRRAEATPPTAAPVSEPVPATNNWFALVLRRTDENRLLLPSDDSALHYYDLLKQSGGPASELQRATAALGAKLAANAQVEIYRKDLDLADRLLGQAREIGYAGDDLAAAQGALNAARAPIAPTPATPTDRTIASYVAPEYPRDALERGIEGWIDVRLQVNAAGDVVESNVEAGQRREVFESAAVLATLQWKYAPRPDSTTLDTVKTRVRFRLKD